MVLLLLFFMQSLICTEWLCSPLRHNYVLGRRAVYLNGKWNGLKNHVVIHFLGLNIIKSTQNLKDLKEVCSLRIVNIIDLDLIVCVYLGVFVYDNVLLWAIFHNYSCVTVSEA